MMHILLITLTAAITMLALDFMWIATVAHPAYVAALTNQLRSFEHAEPMVWISVIMVYILMVSSFMVFIVPRLKHLSLIGSCVYAGFLGLVIYGVFAMTNFAILKHWTIPLLALDTCWGAILFGCTALVVKLIFKSL